MVCGHAFPFIKVHLASKCWRVRRRRRLGVHRKLKGVKELKVEHRALPDITFSPEVWQIFKIRTHKITVFTSSNLTSEIFWPHCGRVSEPGWRQRESISNEFFSASLHLDFLSISKGIIIFVFCSEPFSNIVLRFLSQLFTAELRQQDQWCPRIIYQWKTALEISDRLIRILWAKQDPLLWDEQYEIVNGLNVSNHFLCTVRNELILLSSSYSGLDTHFHSIGTLNGALNLW